MEVAMSKKVHAVVVRNTFRSQNVESTLTPDHFWILLEVVPRWCAFFRHLTFKKWSEIERYVVYFDFDMYFALQ